jgi:GNAT superfamily N-acetyltransferase
MLKKNMDLATLKELYLDDPLAFAMSYYRVARYIDAFDIINNGSSLLFKSKGRFPSYIARGRISDLDGRYNISRIMLRSLDTSAEEYGFRLVGSSGFRLVHSLSHIGTVENEDYMACTASPSEEADEIARLINLGVRANLGADTVREWTGRKEYYPYFWIYAVERSTCQKVAVFVSEFDNEIKEGYLDWIQVPPAYRRRGIGRLLMYETLKRMSAIADFATVSGTDDEEAAYLFYTSCGFYGHKWYEYKKI